MDTITKNNKVACPASAEFLDPLSAGYKIHWATPAELLEHGGVCKSCADKFTKAHAPVMSGRRVETPVDLNEHPMESDFQQDHIAFDEAHRATGVVDFSFDEIDGVLATAPDDARQIAGELLRHVFQFCFGTNRKKLSKMQLTTAAMRLAVVVSGLRPDTLNNATHGQLARALKRTKAAASKANVSFQQQHGIKFARSRDDTARAKMRARRIGGPARHHKDAPPDGHPPP